MQTSTIGTRAGWLADAADRSWIGLEELPGEKPQTGLGTNANGARSTSMASESARLPEGDFARLYDAWLDLLGEASTRRARPKGSETCAPSPSMVAREVARETERLLDRVPSTGCQGSSAGNALGDSPASSIVAHLSLIEPSGAAGKGLVYRFAGRETEQAAGRTMTGRSLALLPSRNGWVGQVLRNVAIVRHTRRPLYCEGVFVTFLNGMAGVRASSELLLPLFDAAGVPSCSVMFQKVRLLDRAHSEPFLFADEFRPGRRVLIGRRIATPST